MAACAPVHTPDLAGLLRQKPQLETVLAARPTVWINPHLGPAANGLATAPLTAADVDDAEARLARFAPLIEKRFPETTPTHGVIESPLAEIPSMLRALNDRHGANLTGRLLLKQDSHLAIAGSVKARGGIYEVLKHAEVLALAAGFLDPGTSYERLLEPDAREFFGRRTVQVGSTGNLGMSIGIMSGSARVPRRGAHVGRRQAVEEGPPAQPRRRRARVRRRLRGGGARRAGPLRRRPNQLLCGRRELPRPVLWATRWRRGGSRPSSRALNVTVDADHPLFVYLPCGVGGAPGGIAFGLKQVFGDAVHCFFVEPIQAPCMLLGMATGLHSGVCGAGRGPERPHPGRRAGGGPALGIRRRRHGAAAQRHLHGGRQRAPRVPARTLRNRGIFVEPSAAAAFAGPARLMGGADDTGIPGLPRA